VRTQRLFGLFASRLAWQYESILGRHCQSTPRGHYPASARWGLAGGRSSSDQTSGDVLVSKLQADEAAELGLSAEAELCEAGGIIFRSFPIPDRETPHATASFSQFVEDLRAEVHAGHSVAVHCRASIGRSSLLLAALLTAEGFTAEDAFRRLSIARGLQVPDTQDQVRWVEQFAATHQLSRLH
jgi:protein-tyrosine phosphatase